MKHISIKLLIIVFTVCLQSFTVQAQTDSISYNIYKGKVLDQASDKPLLYASVLVDEKNIATITNSEGEFTLKIASNQAVESISITHLGYQNKKVLLDQLSSRRNIIKLIPKMIPLDEVEVIPDSPEGIIIRMLRNININYPDQPNNMTAFYRESISKKNKYVALSEAVINIYKSAYKGFLNDQVKIYKGRKGQDTRHMDTLLFKLQGGPNTVLLLDLIKNPSVVLSEEILDDYRFEFTNMITIDNRINYVIAFQQRYELEYPLFYGRFFIDKETYALTGADFSMNLENPEKAAGAFIKKKPFNVKVHPVQSLYSVRYRQQDGKWYFQHARSDVKFKVKWKRKLFSTTYSTMSEIAITDRNEQNVERIKGREVFRSNKILSEEVESFSDINFWEGYNTIEPDSSIEEIIKKLQKILKD